MLKKGVRKFYKACAQAGTHGVKHRHFCWCTHLHLCAPAADALAMQGVSGHEFILHFHET
eukprot:scaffold178408_cov22-Tisochrysis_lutea.AAC.1